MDPPTLRRIAGQAGFNPVRSISFPFPHFGFGKIFPYNEFVVVGELGAYGEVRGREAGQ
jgi:hypothetical protein